MFSGTAIRKIKKEKAYLTTCLIDEAISYYQKFVVCDKDKEPSGCKLNNQEFTKNIQTEEKIDSLEYEANQTPKNSLLSCPKHAFLNQSGEMALENMNDEKLTVDCFINFERNENGNNFFFW